MRNEVIMIFRKTVIIYLFIFFILITPKSFAENNEIYPFKLEDYLPEHTQYAKLNYNKAFKKENDIQKDEFSYFIAKTLYHLKQKLGGRKSEKENFIVNYQSNVNLQSANFSFWFRF